MRACLLATVAACSAPGADAPPDARGTRDALATTTLPELPDAPRVDAAPGAPDLTLLADEMAGTVVVQDVQFFSDDCAIVEGCVGAAGLRHLLRFDTVTANLGTADLALGVPTADNPIFEWSACHAHYHVRDYASYELRDAGGAVVVTGRKQAFCLEDVEQVDHTASATGYSCANQGISRGWADVYGRYLPCQWIDVTGIPSGAYTLRVTVNPLGALPDSNPDNNVFETAVSI